MELNPYWRDITSDYKIIKLIGQGTFGQVVKAKHRATGEYVAIKLISDCFYNSTITRQILREVMLMRRLKKLKNNIFTVGLKDIILQGSEGDPLGLEMEKTHDGT